MFQRILVLCTGNICRSPVVEALLRQALPERDISSAGLGALVGQGVEPTARELAEADGLDVHAHQARQVTQEMLQSADLILVMSEGQRRAVADLAPAALGKTMLIGRWLDGGKGREIPDPYRKSREAFEHVHELLKEATAAWVSKL
ncbi:low molecular weight protein-tyrosine-phosphatase [Halomonas beimenensis]|uniref:protein-tyrosine-phosphatase n=1 Tax=Halomonas beimenensis TaxID=475662 RepID=A0A291P6W3_9GAMM|nr:low molecular weight protein-tyrosine-phosphatase [Halomonas beimenensis]ATJ82653.1 low molecular weight protein-tyrosine-phosphatase Wzb [Halomonas beimenensis]